MRRRRFQTAPPENQSSPDLGSVPGPKITLLKPSFWSSGKSTDSLVHHRESLSRKVEALKAEVERLKEVVRFKNGVLQDEVEFLEEFLRGPASVTYEALSRRVSRLKGAIGRLKGGLD